MSNAHPTAVNTTLRFEPQERFMRLTEVVRVTGLSRSQIYRLMGRKEFPTTIPLGPCTVAWRQSQINGWICEKIESAMRNVSA